MAIGTADRVIMPVARHAHAHITEVRAPQLAMISDPGVVTQVILEARGWREVADTALAFTQRFSNQQPAGAETVSS